MAVASAEPPGERYRFTPGLDIVRLLVEQGADPARTDSRGRTPAEAAAANGHQPITEYLRSRV
ncbi:MAG TPA: ankyrin repeat domain-containing protein [Gemmataceae bacterium]